MNQNLMGPLSRAQHEAIESAGYRITRWAAAREVLQSRVMKGRIAEPVGNFLAHWLSLASRNETDAELWLSFNYEPDGAKLMLDGGSEGLARSPLERALLHLPALRPFWSQELRRQHFEALRNLLPRAWLLDAAEVPPGAVIEGLGTVSWEGTQLRGQEWNIHGPEGQTLEDWRPAVAARNSILTVKMPAGIKLNATYGRNDIGQVVLRSLEAAP